MAHTCFITFKTEDLDYKLYIQNELQLDIIDRSLSVPIESEDDDYIMRKIREDYLSNSTVTIILIGTRSEENLGWSEQRFIKRELQASLYNGSDYGRSGVLGVVLPNMYHKIYGGTCICNICGNSHNYVNINDSTVIKEFSYNYYIPHNKCSWSDEERYCILVKWDDFINNPRLYTDQAYDKRSEFIANKTRVKP